jgi:hypothetical protein
MPHKMPSRNLTANQLSGISGNARVGPGEGLPGSLTLRKVKTGEVAASFVPAQDTCQAIR